MEQHDVGKGRQFVMKSFERGPCHLSALGQIHLLLRPVVSPPHLGQDRHIVAFHLAKRFAEVHVRAVQIGQVEEANPAVVRVMHQIDKLRETHACLIRLPIAAMHASALAKSRHFDFRLAKLDHRRRRRPVR